MYSHMVSDLTASVQQVLAAGNGSVKVVDCEVGDTVTLIFGVYRVEMTDGRKQFVRQRELTEVEKGVLAQSLKIQKASGDDLHW